MISNKRDNSASYGAGGATGLPADRSGNPTVDPTKNVLDLVNAAVKRLDDLSEVEMKRVTELFSAKIERLDAIIIQEVRRNDERYTTSDKKFDQSLSILRQELNDNINLRAEYTEKLTLAEAKRIDAIRAVDVNAVGVASERATQQATVLANQVAASAETLRALVAATAATIAQQLASLTTQLTDRISSLEKSQYTISGTSAISNPATEARFDGLSVAMTNITKEIASLRETRSQTTGGTEQSKATWGIIAGVAGIAISVILLVLRLMGQ